MYAMINPRSAQLYAPDQGAAMALIFTLLVFVIGYGLQWAVSLRAIGRVRGRVLSLGVGTEPEPVTIDEEAPDTLPVTVQDHRALSRR